MKPTRVFIHGLESSGHGTKGEFFRKRYPDMIIEDFFGSFPQRMEKLEGLLANRNNLILVGSSYGGLMAAVYACLHEVRVTKLVLLAPAINLEPYEPYCNTILRVPVTIVHGLQDDIVPLPAVREIAERSFVNLDFRTVDDDHPLSATFPSLDWDAFLSGDNCKTT
jgi:pimeloyl-ACP methyl ester carboxylesterase